MEVYYIEAEEKDLLGFPIKEAKAKYNDLKDRLLYTNNMGVRKLLPIVEKSKNHYGDNITALRWLNYRIGLIW